MSTESVTSPASTTPSPRFEIELEFVSALANPAYLQYLAVTFPNLFIRQEQQQSSSTAAISTTSDKSTSIPFNKEDNSDADCFGRYLTYLLEYWRKPEYVQYLTHPAATIRNLELLQNEKFRKDIMRPDVLEKLTVGFTGVAEYMPPEAMEGIAQARSEDTSASNVVDATSNGAD